MSITVKKKNNTFIFASTGFPYSSFDKAGKVEPWHISKYFQMSRRYIITDEVRDFKIRTGFLRFQRTEFSPEFYNIKMNRAWEMETDIKYIGGSSIWFDNTIIRANSGTPLVHNLNQVVIVNRSTRRPVKLDRERLIQVYQVDKTSNAPWFEFSATTPDKVFGMSRVAVDSETDRNNHVNQSECIKYCMDCVTAAARQGDTLTYFTKEVAFYNLKSMSIWYLGEIVTGDEVIAECWEDQMSPYNLFFLLKVRGKIVTQVIGEWYKNKFGINQDPTYVLDMDKGSTKTSRSKL